MSKKRKNNKKRKPKALTAAVLEKRLIDLFSKQVTARLDAKGVIKKLRISNSKDSVHHHLEQLVQKGLLAVGSKGKYKWNKKAPKLRQAKSDSEHLATGRVDATRRGSAYIICDDPNISSDIFVPPHKMLGALNGDTVEVAWYRSRKDKLEGRIVRVVERKLDHFMGTLRLSPKFAFVVPDNPNMATDIFVALKNVPKEAEDGARVVVQITKWHTDQKSSPEGKITTYFGTEDSNDIEMKSLLVQKGFNLTFPPEVLQENAAIDPTITPAEISRRRDMRDITTFTIDPATAKDFDDALSIELLKNGNYEIGIHIADVSHYVRPGTELDKEAARRTTSVYLVDRVLPMLPEKLSNGVCSLRPHEEKLTFSAVFELDHQANIINEWFGRTVIYSDRRFTYEEAQEGLDTGEGDFAEELRLLNKYAHKLRQRRLKKGAINFESPEIRFVLGEDGVPLDVYLKERRDANMLIEDFMLLANKRVGALIHNLHQKLGFVWPMVYRIHDQPDMERVAQFADFAAKVGHPLNIKEPEQVKREYGKLLKKVEGQPEEDILQQLAIRTMAKAVYSTDNIGHYGLGFDTYSHFTSPIRRYADVLAHRILYDYLSNNNKRMKAHELEQQCKYISKKERDAMEAERESIKYKQAEFIENHVGEIFEGSISGIADHGLYVSLKANFCEGMVRYERMYAPFQPDEHRFYIRAGEESYKMGDIVWVRILGADKIKRQIDMELLDPQDPENRPPKREPISTTKPQGFPETQPTTEAMPTTPKATPEQPISRQAQKEIPASESIPTKQAPKREKRQVLEDELPRGRKVVGSNYKANNKPYEAILPAVAKAYKKSHISQIAKQRRAKWFYELSPSAPVPGSVLLLELNPIAVPNKGYRAQKFLSQHPYRPAGATKSFFKTYFSEQAISVGYWSPFRTLDEKQLDEHDLKLSLPLFKAYVEALQPACMVGFSLTLVNTLREFGLLENEIEQEIEHGQRTIVVSKATLVLDDLTIPIAFVPRPSSRLLKVLKTKAWEWAFEG